MTSIHQRLAGFYFSYYAIIGTFMPFWNLYLEQQGFHYQQIGWLSSIAIITRLFAPFIWGWIADKTAKRMLLIRIACAVECFIWLAIFIIPNQFQSVALLMFIFSFFQNAILAQFEGVTLFYLDKQKQHYARIRKWGSIGFIAGVIIVGGLFYIFPIQILPIILLIITFLALCSSFTIQEPNNAPKSQKTLMPILPVLKQPAVFLFFTIQFLLLFSHAPFYSFYSNYLHQFQYTTFQIGLLWSLGVVAEIIMFAYAHLFFKRFSMTQLIALCLIMTALRWCIVGLFPSFGIIQAFAQCIHAFSFGLFHLIAMKMIAHYFQAEQQGRAQAIYSTIWGIGVALGSILAGNFWHILQGDIIFMSASIICAMAIFFTFRLDKYLKMFPKE